MNDQLQIVLLSLKVSTLATLFNLPWGIFLGWIFARKNFPGKSLLDGLVTVPLVLPPVVTGYLLLIIFGPRGLLGRYLEAWFGLSLAFSWKAAVLAAAVVSFPLLVRAVRVAVDSVDYRLEEAAKVLRLSNLEIFFKITLPLSAHGIIAGAVLAFARGFGEFGATIIFASNIPGKTQTIPLAIFTYLNQPGGEVRVKWLVLIAILFSYICVLINELWLRRFRTKARMV